MGVRQMRIQLGIEGYVHQRFLDLSEIYSGFEELGCIGMSQRMNLCVGLDLNLIQGTVNKGMNAPGTVCPAILALHKPVLHRMGFKIFLQWDRQLFR